jgi:hypothetical protein
MSEESKITEETDIEDSYYETLSDHIVNLTAAINNLSEIDAGLLSQTRQRKLAKIKRLIFDSLLWHCECLPTGLGDDDD